MDRAADNECSCNVAKIGVLVALALWLLSTCCGCYGPHKALRQVIKAQERYPGVTYSFFARTMPVKTHDSTAIVYKPGKPIPGPVRYIKADCESLRKADPAAKFIYVPCPPDTNRVDTLSIYKKLEQESTLALAAQKAEYEAKLQDLQKRLSDAEKKEVKAQTRGGSWRLFALLFIGYTAVRLLLLWLTKGVVKLP